MNSSVADVYDLVSRLDSYILAHSSDSNIIIKVYTAYKQLLKKRNFIKAASNMNGAKLRYLNGILSVSKSAKDERVYYDKYINKIVNLLVDSLAYFVKCNETETTDPIKYVCEHWPSLHEYWINGNKNTSLDTEWVLSLIEQRKQPLSETKVILKMFVFCCVIRTEVLQLPKPSFPSIPMFDAIYSQAKI